MKRAFLTGIGGQTASYLAEHLLDQGYEVTGMVRRNSIPEHQESRIAHLDNRIQTFYGDITDASSVEKILQEVKPDYIFNLCAQSHVRISFDIPVSTVNTNALGVMILLEAHRNICPNARLLQASSSEMFGNSVDTDGFQRESTPMHPVSPYGCSKLFSYSLIRNYRKAYHSFLCNSICFNHESARRGSNFVTNKVVKAAVRIKKGLQDSLEMGNMTSFRDWGHASDYAQAMIRIINHGVPDDFVVSTGVTHSVQDMCDYVFGKLGLDSARYIAINEKYMRPDELQYLKGDSTKMRETFNWQPHYTFETLMDSMIAHWEEVYR